MILLKRITYVFIATLLFASCSSDDDSTIIEPDPKGDYEKGILITNEGPFGNGIGTVTFISEDYSVVDGEIFNDVNGTDLGNIVQSMGFSGDNAYIVVNNSHKIEVVNRYTFESIATIDEGLNNPRYFVADGNTGYVTNWGDPYDEADDFIAIIDLTSNTVTSNISVGFGPEKVIESQGNIYVLHKGGFNFNNILSVIDTDSKSIETIIEVGYSPDSIYKDGLDLWVLCGGKPSYTGEETAGSLFKIDNDNNSFLEFEFEIDEHPSNLVADTLNSPAVFFLLNGNIVRYNGFDFSSFETSTFGGSFYSLGINENLDLLFATDASDFSSNGELKVFRSDDSLTNEIESFTVGIIPGGVYFNN